MGWLKKIGKEIGGAVEQATKPIQEGAHRRGNHFMGPDPRAFRIQTCSQRFDAFAFLWCDACRPERHPLRQARRQLPICGGIGYHDLVLALRGNEMLNSAMNNTKWDELRLEMYALTPPPSWSTFSTNGYRSEPDREVAAGNAA